MALECLFLTGKLLVSYRKNFQKTYDLTENVLPSDIDIEPIDVDLLPENTEGIQTAGTFQYDAASTTPIAAVGSSLRNVNLPVSADTPVSAVAALYEYFSFVHKHPYNILEKKYSLRAAFFKH